MTDSHRLTLLAPIVKVITVKAPHSLRIVWLSWIAHRSAHRHLLRDSSSIVRCGSVIIPPSQHQNRFCLRRTVVHVSADLINVGRQVSDCIWPSLYAALVSAAS
jgi:hypothetical protein